MAQPRKGFDLLLTAFSNRKTVIMLVYGMAAGLPYALLLGTLYAWLGETGVDLETMGVFSLIGLAYAFKFLWSPLVDRGRIPLLWRLGRRRSWLVPIQALVGLSLIVLSALDPQRSIGIFSLIAGIAAFASATQDIVIDAWRVEVADDDAPIEVLSSVYQLGYRIAALAGGALALIVAAQIGWATVYTWFGIFMLVAMAVSWVAPDTAWDEPLEGEAELRANPLNRRVRIIALAAVGVLWGWALVTVLVFMVRSLSAVPAERPNPTEFITFYGPLIVIATVVVPTIMAAVLDGWRRKGRHLAGETEVEERAFRDHAYEALIEPLSELAGRLRWAAILVLAIVLSYRLTDSIWGPFALPFYIQELGYSNNEVAFASKFFGVGMTMAGIALGAMLFTLIGRMPTVVLGALTAALTNLLYADLALGGAGLDAFGRASGFYALVETIGADARLGRLLLAITGENLAGGLAGAAFVAYLSSITARSHAAVQYALLSSLTVLVGSLGRAALGEQIDVSGYAPVFYLTAAIGMIAVVLCVFEWLRQAREERRQSGASSLPESTAPAR